jgi:rubrerythrin
MEKFSIDEILEQAIQTENLGYQFYTEMSNKFKKNEELAVLFRTLADKETEHKTLFSCMKDTLDLALPTVEDWEEVSHYMRAIVESEFFLGSKKSLAGMDQIQSLEQAVDRAIGYEKETLLYFIGFRDIVHDKKVIDFIIEEERCHIKSLSVFKHNLKASGK